MICPPVTARLISLSAQSTLVSSLLRSVMTSPYSNVPTHSEQRAAFPSFTNCSGYLKFNYLVWIYAHHRMKPCMCTEQIHSSCTEGYRDIMYRTCCHMGISVTPYSYPLMGKYQRSVCCRKAQGCIYRMAKFFWLIRHSGEDLFISYLTKTDCLFRSLTSKYSAQSQKLLSNTRSLSIGRSKQMAVLVWMLDCGLTSFVYCTPSHRCLIKCIIFCMDILSSHYIFITELKEIMAT